MGNRWIKYTNEKAEDSPREAAIKEAALSSIIYGKYDNYYYEDEDKTNPQYFDSDDKKDIRVIRDKLINHIACEANVSEITTEDLECIIEEVKRGNTSLMEELRKELEELTPYPYDMF
jgi:hypothetical protein